MDLRTTAQSDDSGVWAAGGPVLVALLQHLPAYLLRQRWYPAKNGGLPTVALRSGVAVGGGSEAILATWTVAPPGAASMRVFLPVVLLDADDSRISGDAVIASCDGRVACDAVVSDAFVRDMVRLLLGYFAVDSIQSGRTEQAADQVATAMTEWQVRRSSAEQSNTSIRIGDGAILKVIRKLVEGVHPELEMGRYLTARVEPDTIPALLGWMNVDGCTMAILQSFVPNRGDGWTWVLARLQENTPTAIAATLAWIARLGRRTAQMHAALASPSDDAAFAPEPARAADWARWIEAITVTATRVAEDLRRHWESLDEAAQAAAVEFDQHRARLADSLKGLIPSQTVAKTRHHGDFHLGQVLVRDDDVTLVDFEGEPLRSLDERRAKHIPVRDVAGMLRSFDYAAAVAERAARRDAVTRPNADSGPTDADLRLSMALKGWAAEASRVYLASYLEGTALDRDAVVRMVRLFTFEKALYEVEYELANRPSWVSIPLRGMLALFDGSQEI